MTRLLNVEQFIADMSQRPIIWNRNFHGSKAFIEETWIELAQRHNLPKATLKAKWKGLRDNFRVEYKRIPRDDTGFMIIRPEDHDSKWIHYKALLFLIDHMRNRTPKQFYYQDGYDDDDSNSGPMIMPVQAELNTSKADEFIEIPDDDIFTIDGVTVNIGTVTTPKMTNGNSVATKNTNGLGNGIKRPRLSDLDTDDDSSEYSVTNRNPPENRNGNGKITPKKDDDYHFLMSMHPFMAKLNGDQKLRVRMKMQKLIFRELYPTGDKPTNSNDVKVEK